VRKKMRATAFAAAVDREALVRGAEELGVDFDEHVAFVVGALEPRAEDLGLAGAPAAAGGAPASPAPDAAPAPAPRAGA
jgi:hypothetical protein